MARTKTQASQETIALAEKLLSETFGGCIRLDDGDDLGGSKRSLVYRFKILDGPGDAPASVIVKQAHSTADAAYQPDSPTLPAWTLFNDWASLQFLNQLPNVEKLAPQFYCGDRASGLFIMEDLGSGLRLDQLLQGDDAVAAESALIEFAAIHGRLHAMTIGMEDEFLRIREMLGPSKDDSDYYDYTWLAATLHDTVALLDIKLAKGADAELAALAVAMQHPGPFLAFTQGDSCPDNCLYIGSALSSETSQGEHTKAQGTKMQAQTDLCLLDFEGGMFRHALVEGVYGRMHFPTCWCVYRLPKQIPSRMEAAYRAELVKGCPAASDDRLFYHAVAEACALWMLDWYHEFPLSELLEEDRKIVTSTVRQRLLVRSDTLAQVTEEAGHMEAIGATVRAIATKLRTLWPEADALPYYPAFCS